MQSIKEIIEQDQFLQELLASPLLPSNSNSSAAVAAAIRKADYQRIVAFRNVMSYSMQQQLYRCPREFQFSKLRAATNAPRLEAEQSVTFAFGHAVGAGVAIYDQTRDMQKALFATFLAWEIDLFAVSEKRGGKESFDEAMWAVESYATFFEEELSDLDDMELAGIESTIAIDLENNYFYVGHIDELWKSKDGSRFLVKENKTDGSKEIDPAKYSNSDQALSYSAAVAASGGSSYSVLYTIYSKPEQRWIRMDFAKPKLARIHWLQDQGMTSAMVNMYADANFFPKRGGSCIRFNRRCHLYEECDMNPDTMFGMKFDDLPRATMELLDMIEHYDIKVTWSDVVKSVCAEGE
jgi:hypothetical protein